MKKVVYPAILAQDWDTYRNQIEVASHFAEGVQIDVMDGKFVPAKSFYDSKKVESLKPGSLFFEMHLMVSDIQKAIREWASVANSYIMHVEAADDLSTYISEIRSMKREVGIALNPDTPIDAVIPYIPNIHMVLIMSVIPGEGGQSYLVEVNEKIRALRALYPKLPIEVDGGVNAETIPDALEAGANMFVAGTAIWGTRNPKEAYMALQKKAHI